MNEMTEEEFRAEMHRRGFDEAEITEAVETRNADSLAFSLQIPFEIYLREKILLRRYLLNGKGHLVDEEKLF